MSKIPTAKEKLLTDCPFLVGKITEEGLKYIQISMKEFAKLHLKAALEAAHKAHQLPEEDLEFTLSAYPENNIV